MTTELKPCPFCGSKDVYYNSCYPWGAFSCNSCECDGPPIRKEEDEIGFDDSLRMEEAKSAWNKRFKDDE